MISKAWLDSLKDPDPEVRMQAIRSITNSGDDDAMKILAQVYKNDSDPDVREMARQGGIKLRQMGHSLQQQAPEPEPLDDDVYDPMAGLYETPIREEAPQREYTPPSSSSNPVERQDRPSTQSGANSWATIAPDLFLYFVIVAVGTFIVTTVLAQSLSSTLDEIYATATAEEAQQIRDIFEQSTSALAILSSVTAVLAVITLVIQTWIIHYMATNSFGGMGNMFSFIRKFAIANGVLTVAIYGLTLFFVSSAFAAMPDLTGTTTTTTTTVSSGFESLFVTLCCGSAVAFIAVFWYFGRMISRHYFIGTWQAIGAFIAGSIAAQILTQILSNLFI